MSTSPIITTQQGTKGDQGIQGIQGEKGDTGIGWQVATDPDNIWNTNIGFVGVNTAAPEVQFHVVGICRAQAVSGGGVLQLARAAGEIPLEGTAIGTINFRSDAAVDDVTNQARIRAVTSEDWSPTNKGTHLSFATTESGGTSNLEKMRIRDNGEITGLFKGTGVTQTESKLEVITQAAYDLLVPANADTMYFIVG